MSVASAWLCVASKRSKTVGYGIGLARPHAREPRAREGGPRRGPGFPRDPLGELLMHELLSSGRRSRSYFLALTLGLSIALASCAGTPEARPESNSKVAADRSNESYLDRAPAWVREHPKDNRFPTSRYLVGLGIADTSRGPAEAALAAEDQAKAEIARILRTQIESVVESWLDSSTSNQSFFNQSGIEERIRSTANVELNGAQVVDQWNDEESGQLWIKVVLSRETLARDLLAETQSALIGATVDPQAEGAPSAILADLLGSWSLLDRALGRLAGARAAIDLRSPAGNEVLAVEAEALARAEEIQARISELSSMADLVLLGQPNRELNSSGNLAQPLNLLATFGDAPFSGFPLSFHLPEGVRGTLSEEGGGAPGQVQLRIIGLHPGGMTSVPVEARFDFQRFAPTYPLQRTPSLLINLYPPSLASRTFAILVAGPGAEKVERATMQVLEANQAKLLGPRSLPAGWMSSKRWTELDVDQICGALKGRCEFALRATVQVEAQQSDKAFISYAGLQLDWIDVEKAQVLARLSHPPSRRIRGIHPQSQERADLQALQRLNEWLREELHGELGKRFALPAGSQNE